MGKYDYLKKYINNKAHYPENGFNICLIQEINKQEKRLGFKFPKALKEFWLNIGYGALRKSKNNEITGGNGNFILSPKEVADMILLRHEDQVLPDIEELFDEGWINIEKEEIIFFEIGNSSSFLVMKPNSIKPDGIYDMYGWLLVDSFEEFIWRLYHESPDFHLYLEDKSENSPENLAILEQERESKRGG